MSRSIVGHKAQSTLKLLTGMRHPRVADILTGYGLSDDIQDEGWALVREVARCFLSPARDVGQGRAAASSRRIHDSAVSGLAAWQRRWFTVGRAVLDRHHPGVSEALFLELPAANDNDRPNNNDGGGGGGRSNATLSVGTFLAHLDALRGGTDDERAAWAILARHGLDDETIALAQTLLAEARRVVSAPPPLPATAEMRAMAVQAMWDYYRMWSTICRAAITDAALLGGLGLSEDRAAAPERAVPARSFRRAAVGINPKHVGDDADVDPDHINKGDKGDAAALRPGAIAVNHG